MTARVQFKPGDTFTADGAWTIPGITDFTDYTVEMEIRQRSDATGLPGSTKLGELAITPVAPDGTFVVEIPATTTKDWPVEATLGLDIVLRDPEGRITTTDTGLIETVVRYTDPFD